MLSENVNLGWRKKNYSNSLVKLRMIFGNLQMSSEDFIKSSFRICLSSFGRLKPLPNGLARSRIASSYKLNLCRDLRWVAKRDRRFPRRHTQVAKKDLSKSPQTYPHFTQLVVLTANCETCSECAPTSSHVSTGACPQLRVANRPSYKFSIFDYLPVRLAWALRPFSRTLTPQLLGVN